MNVLSVCENTMVMQSPVMQSPVMQQPVMLEASMRGLDTSPRGLDISSRGMDASQRVLDSGSFTSGASRGQLPVLQFKTQEAAPLKALPVNERKENFCPLQKRKDVPAVIKVISAGGGGANALNRMIEEKLIGVDFISVNTDVQDLYKKSNADVKLQIGAKITGGWGAGGNPDVGEKAALEDKEEIADVVKDADMVFVTAGMGGGTGTGSAPVIAKIAKDMGALTVGVVTTPFEFEADFKIRQAQEGIKKLREAVDTLIIIPSQYLFKIIDSKTTFDEAFRIADNVLCRAVQGISEIITKTGFINIDFNDAKTVMKDKGDALMGIGYGSGENRAIDAVTSAIDNPLLEDTSINGATGVLINIAGPDGITLVEINNIVKTIKEKCDKRVNLTYGLRTDHELGEGIKVTVIATGFQGAKTSDAKQPAAERTADSTFIDGVEYGKMFERTKRPDYLPYLAQREYQEDLDVPSAIRRLSLQTEKSVLEEAARQ